MSLRVVDRHKLLNDELRQFAERRILFALSRFDSLISNCELAVGDENGPRGGLDKSCRISVTLLRAQDVVVTDRDAELETCIARAAERAGRAVSRAIERSQEFDRPRRLIPDG